MIVPSLIKIAIRQFEQKMLEFSENCNSDKLTAQLAQQVSYALKEALSAAARTAFQSFIQSYDVCDPVIQVNGQRLRWKTTSPKTFLTCFGLMTIHRSLYQADAGGKCLAPLDEFWGMDGEFATEEVREAVLFSVAHLTPAETEQLLKKCALFCPSATAIKHIVEKVGDFIEEHSELLDDAIRCQEQAPQGTRTLVASLDGANVLLHEPGGSRGRPSERPGKDKPPQKTTAYKNAMVGSFSFYGDVLEGQDTPERLASRYIARMPESRAITFKQQFEQELSAAEAQAGLAVNKVLLLDAHRSLWKYVQTNKCFDDYQKLIDYYHTTEHLSQAAEALFGKKSAYGKYWYNKYRARLLQQEDAGKAILRSINYYSRHLRLGKARSKALAQERTFFGRNKTRMSYAQFRARGLPISSGPVEAACKTIVKTRMCRSGMRWSRRGGQRILDLRSYVKSGRWDSFWQHYICLRRAG